MKNCGLSFMVILLALLVVPACRTSTQTPVSEPQQKALQFIEFYSPF